MRPTSTITPRNSLALLASVAFFAVPAAARTLTVDVASLAQPQLRASGVHLSLDDGAQAVLRLSVRQLDVPALALSGTVEWTCAVRRDAQGDGRCEGPVELRDGAGRTLEARLAVEIDRARIGLRLMRDGSEAGVDLPLADGASRAWLHDVPTAWVAPALAVAWPDGLVRRGALDVDARVAGDGRVEAGYAVRDLAFGTRDGALSAAALAATGSVSIEAADEGPVVHLVAKLQGGSLHAGTLAFDLPDAPVEVAVDAGSQANGRVHVSRLAWRDPGVLELDGSASFDPAAMGPLQALDIVVRNAVFPAALDRYGAALLAQQGAGDLRIAGRAAGGLVADARGVRRVRLDADMLDIAWPSRTFELDGLHGVIDWTRDGERPAAPLAWRGGRVGGFAIPAANTRWRSRAGALELVGELRAPMATGTLVLRDTMVHPTAVDGERIATAFSLANAGYERADGLVAFAEVDVDGTLRASGPDDALRLRVDARWNGAKALVGAVYVELPPQTVTSSLDVTLRTDRWIVDAFRWDDPGTLVVDGSGEFAPASAQPIGVLRVDLREVDLAPAVARYARTWLATAGYPDFRAAGRVSGHLERAADGLRAFGVSLEDVAIASGDARFAFDGLDGDVDWSIGGERAPTMLAWDSAWLFGIELDAARAALQAKDGALALREPVAVGVLGGTLRIERMSLEPNSPRGERYAASFALAGIEMAQLSRTLGWPEFPGNLSGGIPEVVLAGDVIELRGGLDLYAFDGHLGMNSLRLERPFGVAPSLAANVHFENLDLQQVTSAFSFGGMSGRLFGTVNGLRLVDWSPVAFDAWLRTRGGGRMSYNAVDDVASIGGGGGLGGGLQAMALQVFDTFGYRELGIRCRLLDEVCRMAGIDPAPADAAAEGSGYAIIEGSGVPRIRIVGHHRDVDWPTLVSRLVEATRGKGPVVR